MLVLSRRREEQIIIRDDIVVTVVDIRRDKVRLGIEAPSSVPVHRREVWDAIQRERAGQATPTVIVARGEDMEAAQQLLQSTIAPAIVHSPPPAPSGGQ
jgi:carbon storage regulator